MDTFHTSVASVVVACSVIAAVPERAWASDAPSAAELSEARERFAEGRKLEEAGKFSEALTAFQQVARVKTTPQVRFHIALCLMHTGKLVDALENFRIAIQEAGATAPNVVAEAKEHIAALEKRVAAVTIDVPSSEPTGSVVNFDGRVVSRSTEFYAEPGKHRVELVRSGQTVGQRELEAHAGEHLHFELTAGDDGSAGGDDGAHGRRVASFISFGVAGASAIGLGVFVFLRADRLAQLEAACPSLQGCAPSLEPVVRDGKTYSAMANVFGGVAIATAAAGVALYVSSRSSTSRRGALESDLHVVPVIGNGGGFVTLQGRF